MSESMNRRLFMGSVGAVVAGGALLNQPLQAQPPEPAAKQLKIIGISCSLRKGMTTATSVAHSLKTAAQVNDRIQTELIELAGMNIGVFDPSDPKSTRGDFESLIPKLTDPAVGGIILGTPVYFSNMCSQCKAFLDHCIVFRKKQFALSGKVAGVLAVGGARNGGQELTIQSVQAALLCQEMVVVGDGKPTAHTGATVWNSGKQDVTLDEFGMATAENLGRRVAEMALKLFS